MKKEEKTKKCPISNCNQKVALNNNRCCEKCEEHLAGSKM